MADYRNDPDSTLPGTPSGVNATPERDPEHLIPKHTHAAVPGTIAAASADPDTVRGDIERTRQRMSQTIDHIEDALSRKKGEIQDRLDFVAPVRENPWMFAAGVFGTGIALGLLTGGGDDDDDRDHVKVPRALLAGLELEEDGGRAVAGYGGGQRELLQVIARQEDEIRDLRAALYGDDEELDAYAVHGEADAGAEARGEVEAADEWDEDWNFDDHDDALNDFGAFGVEGEKRGSLGKAVTAAVAAGLAGALGGIGKALVRRRDGGEMDVEVDLEPPHGAATDVPQDQEVLATRRVRGGDAGDRRELDVEVELEQPRRTAAYAGEMDVEAELERPRGRSLPVSPLAGAVAAGAAALVGGLVARLMHDRRGGELEVEVELEGRGRTSSPPPLTAERQYEVELERLVDDVPLM